MSSREPSSQPSSPARDRRLAATVGRVAAWFGLSAMIAIAALLAVTYAFGFLGQPATLAVVRAESEIVRFRVANAVQATVALDGFRVDDGDALAGACSGEALGAGWALEPALGAETTYRFETVRQGDALVQRLTVYVAKAEGAAAAATLRGRDARGTLNERSVAEEIALQADPACGPPAALRLPVWGPGEIGGPPSFRADGQAPTLISGSVEIYGRSTPLEFGFPLSWLGGGESSDDRTLYASVAGAFQAPPGSRISTLASGASDGLKAMRGFATVSGEPPRRIFLVNVSTESPELYFFPPGAGAQPDLLRMGLLSRLSNDPHVQRVVQILVWFVIVLPIALELARPLISRSDRLD